MSWVSAVPEYLTAAASDLAGHHLHPVTVAMAGQAATAATAAMFLQIT
ncbi:hypothetical protein MYIN104542_04525 [Mycobacterium intermedium]